MKKLFGLFFSLMIFFLISVSQVEAVTNNNIKDILTIDDEGKVIINETENEVTPLVEEKKVSPSVDERSKFISEVVNKSNITILTKSAQDYVTQLLSDDTITISNIVLTGSNESIGSFTNGSSTLGIDNGVLFSTGNLFSGPSGLYLPGDTDLNMMTGGETFDAISLEFDFVPKYSNLNFDYVFGSREYPLYVGSKYNDSFAFFVNGSNVAKIPGTEEFVSINNVNMNKNSTYFIDNEDEHLGSLPNTKFGGITTVLPISSSVNPNVVNHIKIVIADTNDTILDSFVGIASNSFKTIGKVNGYYKDENGNTISEDVIIDGNTGESYTIPQKKIPGYKFSHWVGDPTGIIGSEPISVTAIYTKVETFLVDFMSNGGSLVSQQFVEPNNPAINPEAPTKEGNKFIGWYMDKELTTKYDFSLPVTKNLTLYAKWEESDSLVKKEYLVIFESNGGSSVLSQTLEENNLVLLPKEPTKKGYKFEGWYIDNELTTVYDFNNPVTKNLTLYAKWEKEVGVVVKDDVTPVEDSTKSNDTEVKSNGKFLPRTGEVKNYLLLISAWLSIILVFLLFLKKKLNFREIEENYYNL